jgi:hypothetical protein
MILDLLLAPPTPYGVIEADILVEDAGNAPAAAPMNELCHFIARTDCSMPESVWTHAPDATVSGAAQRMACDRVLSQRSRRASRELDSCHPFGNPNASGVGSTHDSGVARWHPPTHRRRAAERL